MRRLRGKRTAALLLVLFCLTSLTSCRSCARETTPAAPASETTEALSGTGRTIEERNRLTPDLERDGVEYARKKDVSAYLFMGIDKNGDLETAGSSLGGQSDTLLLLVLDEEDKCYTVVQINRDTIAKIDLLDKYGNMTGFFSDTQICLSHTFGTGDEKSCENTVRAVSRLLCDIPIDGYISLLMEGIPVVNDIIGGIRVKIEDDFGGADPVFVRGETVELVGEQALLFVRGRMNVGDGSNLGRMRRQRTYMDALSARFREELQDNSAVINDIYRGAEPYMITDLSLGQVSAIALKTLSMKNNGTVTPAGESSLLERKGRSYAQFKADEDDLWRIVLDLFYTPINQ